MWNDTNTTIETMNKSLHKFNAAREWHQFHTPKDLAMAVSIEASELLELFLWNQVHEVSLSREVENEAADVAICLLNFCATMGINLCAAIERKMHLNSMKYPVAPKKKPGQS
jgi:dCTP diphosphatase